MTGSGLTGFAEVVVANKTKVNEAYVLWITLHEINELAEINHLYSIVNDTCCQEEVLLNMPIYHSSGSPILRK